MSGDAPATSSPVSTSDVATEVIESFEATESSTETPTETPAPETPTPDAPLAATTPEAPAIVEPKLSPAAEYLQQQGHRAKKADGRDNWLPIKTVEGMLTRYADQQLGDHSRQTRATVEERDRYKADLDEMYADLNGDKWAFIEKVAQHKPEYREILDLRSARAAAPAPAPVALEMPAPDLTLPDGGKTYSLDGLQKLLEWNTAQVEAKLLPKVDERLKPWQERDAAEKARSEAERATKAVQERTHALMTDAQTWPGFKDHEGDILKLLQEDSAKAKAENRRPTLSLDAAYRQVVIPRLTEDDTKKRERLAREMSAAARQSPTVGRSGGEVPRAPGPISTADIARRVIEQAERGA